MKSTKIVLSCLVAVLMLSMLSQTALAEIKDVPSDHWAYQAVSTLVNRGYLAVYEDGTFQGNEPVDRYTLAVTLARILDEIEAGRASGSADDMTLIRQLTTEFRDELVDFYAERDAIEEKLSETQRTGKATEDRLNRVVAAQVSLQEEVQKLKENLLQEAAERTKLAEEIAGHDQAIVRQQDQLGHQQKTLEEQGQALASHRESLDQMQAALIELESQIREQFEAVDRLENWAGEKSAVFATLQNEDSRLSHEIEELAGQLDVLRGEVEGDMKTELANVRGQLENNINDEVASLKSDLSALEKESAADIAKLNTRLDELIASKGRTDGQFLRELEESRQRIAELTQRNKELEADLQNLAVRLQRENQARQEDVTALTQTMAELESKIGLSEEQLAELNRKITDEVSLQMNATLIREQRLERQLKELQQEFDSFKTNVAEQNKSAKGSATLAMVVAAVSILVGFIR